jgi:hypothetical protein
MGAINKRQEHKKGCQAPQVPEIRYSCDVRVDYLFQQQQQKCTIDVTNSTHAEHFRIFFKQVKNTQRVKILKKSFWELSKGFKSNHTQFLFCSISKK